MIEHHPNRSLSDLCRILRWLLHGSKFSRVGASGNSGAVHIPGKLLIVWDGAPIHRSKAIRQFLSDGAAARIHLERFPGYAPELDPQEGVWRHLKRVDSESPCCADLRETRQKLRLACQRLRQKPSVIQSCLQHSGLVQMFTRHSVMLRPERVGRDEDQVLSASGIGFRHLGRGPERRAWWSDTRDHAVLWQVACRRTTRSVSTGRFARAR
jgi:transposase